MQEKENHLKNAELSMEQNTNMLDGILNNMPPEPVPALENRPLDRVKSLTEKKRSRERER